MASLDDSDGYEDPGPDQVAHPAGDLARLRARERQRTGPGSAARRTLEALEDRRRLYDELADFDDYEI